MQLRMWVVFSCFAAALAAVGAAATLSKETEVGRQAWNTLMTGAVSFNVLGCALLVHAWREARRLKKAAEVKRD